MIIIKDRTLFPAVASASVGGGGQKAGRMLMEITRKTLAKVVEGDKQPPIATFKTSLRDWQNRWKAQRAERVVLPVEARRQPAST